MTAWEYVKVKGPDFGYYPKPPQTILKIKGNGLRLSAQKFFKNQGIKITDQGELYLGSVIGTKSFKEQYTKNKVEGWVKAFSHFLSMHKMIFKQHTQHSAKDYAQIDPLPKNSARHE